MKFYENLREYIRSVKKDSLDPILLDKGLILAIAENSGPFMILAFDMLKKIAVKVKNGSLDKKALNADFFIKLFKNTGKDISVPIYFIDNLVSSGLFEESEYIDILNTVGDISEKAGADSNSAFIILKFLIDIQSDRVTRAAFDELVMLMHEFMRKSANILSDNMHLLSGLLTKLQIKKKLEDDFTKEYLMTQLLDILNLENTTEVEINHNLKKLSVTLLSDDKEDEYAMQKLRSLGYM